MIELTQNISGKQLFAVAMRAIKEREKAIGQRVHVTDFCNVAGLSRTQIYGYKKGENPSLEGLAKIAQGLRAWGAEVVVKI